MGGGGGTRSPFLSSLQTFELGETTSGRHYGSLDLLRVFAGCWAIFAVWITLHKGMGSLLLGEDTAGAAWLLLGLVNVVAAFGTLLLMAMS